MRNLTCLAALLALGACTTPNSDDPTEGTDSETDSVDTGFDTADTAVWIDAPTDEPDNNAGDPDIGNTPLDGTWIGTFDLKAWIVGGNQNDGTCSGDVTFEISGSGSRHVVADFFCPQANWVGAPTGVLLRPGDVDGLIFGTLTKGDWTKFNGVGAFVIENGSSSTWDPKNVQGTFDGDTLNHRTSSTPPDQATSARASSSASRPPSRAARTDLALSGSPARAPPPALAARPPAPPPPDEAAPPSR